MLGNVTDARMRSGIQEIKESQESTAHKLADILELIRETKKMIHLMNEKLKVRK